MYLCYIFSYVFGSILPGDYEIKASTSEDYVYKQVCVKSLNIDFNVLFLG